MSIESGFLPDGEPVSFHATRNKIIAKTLCKRNSLFFSPLYEEEWNEPLGVIDLGNSRKILLMIWEGQELLYVTGKEANHYFIICYWINKKSDKCPEKSTTKDKFSTGTKIRKRSFVTQSSANYNLKDTEFTPSFLREKGLEQSKEDYIYSIVFENIFYETPKLFLSVKEFRRISEVSDRCKSPQTVALCTQEGKFYIYSKKGLLMEINGIHCEPHAILNDHFYNQIIVLEPKKSRIFSFPDGMLLRQIDLEIAEKDICKFNSNFYSYKEFKEKVKPISRLHTILDYQIYRMKSNDGIHSDFRNNSHRINDAEINFKHCNKRLEIFKYLASNPMRNGISLVKSKDSSILLIEGERSAELLSHGMRLIQRSIQISSEYSFGLVGVEGSISFIMNNKRPWERSKRLTTILMMIVSLVNIPPTLSLHNSSMVLCEIIKKQEFEFFSDKIAFDNYFISQMLMEGSFNMIGLGSELIKRNMKKETSLRKDLQLITVLFGYSVNYETQEKQTSPIEMYWLMNLSYSMIQYPSTINLSYILLKSVTDCLNIAFCINYPNSACSLMNLFLDGIEIWWSSLSNPEFVIQKLLIILFHYHILKELSSKFPLALLEKYMRKKSNDIFLKEIAEQPPLIRKKLKSYSSFCLREIGFRFEVNYIKVIQKEISTQTYHKLFPACIIKSLSSYLKHQKSKLPTSYIITHLLEIILRIHNAQHHVLKKICQVKAKNCLKEMLRIYDCMQIHEATQRIALYTPDRIIHLYDMKDHIPRIFGDHEGDITNLVFSNTGKYIASFSLVEKKLIIIKTSQPKFFEGIFSLKNKAEKIFFVKLKKTDSKTVVSIWWNDNDTQIYVKIPGSECFVFFI